MKQTSLIAWLLALFVFAFAAPAPAHEVRPAYLEIDQRAQDTYDIVWKQPTMGEIALHLVPHISNGWLERQPADEYVSTSFLIETWKIRSREPLSGRTVFIEGLGSTITDVFVRVKLLNGSEIDEIVEPEHPELKLDFQVRQIPSAFSYLGLGIEHILTGVDHLLFVLGLLLIVQNRWMLIKTITAFTIAHSITLAIATLGSVNVAVPIVNAEIALSILFLGPEIVRVWRGQTSFTIRHPWVVAFAFGLLHGFGFASGLTALGLPKGEMILALLLFNVGVEVGQLGFVLLVLWIERAFRILKIRWPRVVEMIPAYAVGSFGALWTVQQLYILFGGVP
jgi:hydrogenase/urease accessory protein HupE